MWLGGTEIGVDLAAAATGGDGENRGISNQLGLNYFLNLTRLYPTWIVHTCFHLFFHYLPLGLSRPTQL
jgi:hypothetical protein